MTAVARRPASPALPAAAVAGVVLLAARPALVRATPNPTVVLVALFAGVLALGLHDPPAETAHRGGVTTIPVAAGVIAIGAFAFAAGRLLGGQAPTATTARLLVLNGFAAVAEEAFFRRLWYRLLLPAGVPCAIAGTAVLFAAVHLATYGPAVLPLDLAAGLVFGWQRWASQSWTAPAVTHVLANVLVVI